MSQSLAGQVYETIKREIITCTLMPGQQIAQPQLAERYGVGVTPVREALQKLAREGLIQSIPRFGYLVKTITITDISEIFELRAILESAAVRLAAVRATPAQLELLEKLADCTYVYKDRASYSEFLSHNREFHLELAIASGNRRLVEIISQSLDELNRVFHLGLDLKDSANEMRCEHRDLVNALIQKDADGAEQITLAQIDRSKQRVFEALIPYGNKSSPEAIGQNVHMVPRESN
jgi:DNA-binding GntR family transcriptional regulator